MKKILSVLGIAALLLSLLTISVLLTVNIAAATTLDLQVGSSGDDGYSRFPSAQIDTTELFLQIGKSGSPIYDSFALFTSVTVPQGAAIDVAYISLKAKNTNFDGSGTKSNITLEAADNPSAPTTQGDHAGRTRTTNLTIWDDYDFPDTTNFYNSPSIVSAVGEVVNRSGWSSGQSMLILWDDNGSTDGNYYRPRTYDDGAANAPKLHIEYTASQFGRPDSDVTDGGWEDTTGGDNDGANWDEMDEVTADDGTTYTRGDSSATTMEVGLSDVTDPVSSSGHIIRFRANAAGSGAPERIRIQLYEGSTQIAQGPNQAITQGSWNTYTYTLSGAEADDINGQSGYNDLRLRLIPTASGSDTIDVTWAELEVPAAGAAATCQALTVVVNNPQGQMYFNGTTDDPTGGLWQEENVSEDFQTAVTPAMNVTNDDGSGACDVTLELLTSPGSGRTMKFSLTSTAPNPGVNSVPVGSNVTAVSSLGSGSTQAIYLWVDYDDSQGGSVSPTLRIDTELP